MSGQACLFSGRVQGIRSLTSYEGTSTTEFVVDFHGATDEYLAVCHEDGTVPETACNGGLGARFQDRHIYKRTAMYAMQVRA